MTRSTLLPTRTGHPTPRAPLDDGRIVIPLLGRRRRVRSEDRMTRVFRTIGGGLVAEPGLR